MASASPSPSFTITPLIPPQYPSAFTLADTCFAALDTLLFTSYPPSPTSIKTRTQSRIRRLSQQNPPPRMFKALDTETRQIIRIAHWTIHESDEEIVGASVPEMSRDAGREFYTMVNENKREVLRVDVPVRGVYGRKDVDIVKMCARVELETVFVHPGYRRRGVVSALLEWGIARAERLGLPVYLEATEEETPLYERRGFAVVTEVRFDAAEFGGQGWCEYTACSSLECV
ncbi:hypothetical protein BJY01DRAFT_259765 [Aspergillus pseudoustus]|uniref:N-acetyltransferase domain-containing protein n=1 Tax=Aspergillus pseudoustus TaxID=1810923 RepID=A0ABR4J1M6_9EURO